MKVVVAEKSSGGALLFVDGVSMATALSRSTVETALDAFLGSAATWGSDRINVWRMEPTGGEETQLTTRRGRVGDGKREEKHQEGSEEPYLDESRIKEFFGLFEENSDREALAEVTEIWNFLVDCGVVFLSSGREFEIGD